MNYNTWLRCKNHKTMLETVVKSGLASPRKLRLLAVAFCHNGQPIRNMAFRLAVNQLAASAEEKTRRHQTNQYFHPDWEDELIAEWCGRNVASAANVVREVFYCPSIPLAGLCGTVWSPPNAGAPHAGCRDCGAFFTSDVKNALQNALDSRVQRCPCYGALEPSVYKEDCPRCGGLGKENLLEPVALAALADALEEAGVPTTVDCLACWGEPDPSCGFCDGGKIPNPVLSHLREATGHVPGCWALDWVAGKR